MTHMEPISLVEKASCIVGMTIVDQARNISTEKTDWESTIVKMAEYYDNIIPKSLHDRVMQYSLKYIGCYMYGNSENNEKEIKIFDIILRSHATKLDFYDWPIDMHEAIYSSLSRLKCLRYFRLCRYRSNENLMSASKAIKNMKSLRSFECFNCTDEVVEVVCINCPLRKLNVYFSQQVSDLSVPYILKLQNLQELNISITKISKESCLQILHSFPNLTAVYCNYLNFYLAQITDDSIKLPYEAVQYFCQTVEDVANLTKHCPFITKLDISFKTNIDLSNLAVLNNIKIVKIHSLKLSYLDIRNFIKSAGHQLIELDLSNLVDTSSLSEIRHFCPNLQKFVWK